MTFSWRRILALLVIVVVIAVVLTVILVPGTKRNELIGLGDSYASGEGIMPFVSTSDTASNQCHQSVQGAYPLIAAATLGLTGVNQACSGATTTSMINGYNAEPGQIQNLDHAKDITITIGGNDINALGAVLNTPSASSVETALTTLQPKLVDVFSKVTSAAPLAHVAATGYPDILPMPLPQGCFLSQDHVTALSSELNSLNDLIKQAAASAGVQYIDLSKTFQGHELCTPQPWVNGIDLAHPESALHPNMQGQTAMANTVVAALQQSKG